MKKLIIIPTPIGNLSDVSAHILQALQSVDLLLCESITNTKKLYQLLEINRPPLRRYWQQTEASVLQDLNNLPDTVGLISDAGMPCISDPGYLLVKAWHEQGWTVQVLPGPCVVPIAVAMSGLPSDRFSFEGFLPQGAQKRKKALEEIKSQATLTVLYESPRRILTLCEEIQTVFGDHHRVFIAKELTKKYEWSVRGPVISVIESLKQSEIKGEYVLVLDRAELIEKWKTDALIAKEYLSLSDCASLISSMHPISRSKVYDFLLEA